MHEVFLCGTSFEYFVHVFFNSSCHNLYICFMTKFPSVPSCVSSVSMKGVSRAHPHGCGALTGDSLAPAVLKTNTHHLWVVAVWEVEGLTGPRRRRRRTRRMCGWTSASPTPQASPPTWTAGMSLLSLVGQWLKSMIQSAVLSIRTITHFFLSCLCAYCMLYATVC